MKGVWLAVLLCLSAAPSVHAGIIQFSDTERAFIKSHGPWPPKPHLDPSNRVSGNPSAIELGRRLFFDAEISADGSMSCVTCHDPKVGFTDGLKTGMGRARLPRNTPGLFNLSTQRWYGWDGAADSLWAQSIRPLIAPLEMATNGKKIAKRIRNAADLNCLYSSAFKKLIIQSTEREVLINTAKALAAFQETLVTARTPFDTFRDALINNDPSAQALYPITAQRGLKIFTGKGQCSLCHFGPTFTNGEFGDVGISFFKGKGQIDKGRYEGLQNLKSSPYNLTGIHSDDTTERSALKTKRIRMQHRNWGEFKVPSLRNVARTAPYMHNGSLASLADVIHHYSEMNEERLHVDGEKILKPLHLSKQEAADIEAFLKSLSAPLKDPIHNRSEYPTCNSK